MKKLLVGLLSLVMTATVVGTPLGEKVSNVIEKSGIVAHAGGNMSAFVYGDYDYIIENGTVSVVNYFGSATSLTIPSTINGLTVTSIGNGVFHDCASLTNITIPKSVTSIDSNSFDGTKWLKNKQKENPLVIVNGILVNGAASSGNVVIPNNVTNIEDYAFSGCSDLKSVTIPDSVTSIGDSAFEYCSNLESVKIGNGVKNIGDRVFSGCENLTNVTIPDGVTSIGECAFLYCSSLTSITIPNSVKSIGQAAFDDTKWLKNKQKENPLVIVNGILIDGTTYNENELTIPNNVTTIEYRAFDDCSSLTSVTIPDSVTSIGKYAFYDCTNLTSITIPNSVTSIGYAAFDSTKWLENKQKENPLVIVNGILIDGTTYNGNELTIPNKVTSIGDSAFGYCPNLKSVVIPDSVTSIGERAFDCYNLTSVTIGKNIKDIGYMAFECYKLKSIYVSDLKSWCNINFDGYASNPTCCGADLYLNNQKITNLKIPDGVDSIKNYAFQGCSSLTSVTIPDSVTSIGDSAFEYCSNLESVKIGNGVKNIGDRAFSSCSSLKSALIPSGVKFIGCYAFDCCTNLTSVTIPDGITSIGSATFGNCSNLKSITIPNSVTGIGNSAFREALNLKDVYYNGTKENWNNISIRLYNDNLLNANIHYAKHSHNYKSKITKEPTCKSTGVRTYTCSCGDSYTKKVAKIAHSYKNVNVNSTYFVKGYTGKKCSVCGTITSKKAKALLTMATPKASDNNTTSLKLSWFKVKDAKGYDVYQIKNNKWSKIKTVTGTSFTVLKLKAGTNYKFCVKPYNSKKVYGNQSKTLTATTKAKAVTLKVTAGKKKATLKWNKVTGATGYNVYYKTSAKGKWVKLKSANNKTTSYTKTKLSSKKTYWFKIDTIRKVGKTNYTTAGSTKSVKIK